jgi:hypothetical protein
MDDANYFGGGGENRGSGQRQHLSLKSVQTRGILRYPVFLWFEIRTVSSHCCNCNVGTVFWHLLLCVSEGLERFLKRSPLSG